MNKKLKTFLIVGVLLYISFQYGYLAKRVVSDMTMAFTESYLSIEDFATNKIDKHFNQLDQIKELTEENQELKKTASLSFAFADKLNSILKNNGISKEYQPKVEQVQAISYVKISDYYRVWIDMEDFNESKIYGLIKNGATAGIVVEYNKKPLGLLLGDNKCIFSVYVGDEGIPGVAMGNKENVKIKYIPQWMNPKIGDEVRTSGLDNIFFGGVPVGKVVEIIKEESYQTAIVNPYVTLEVPSFYYLVKEP